jgi:hypothetical protein
LSGTAPEAAAKVLSAEKALVRDVAEEPASFFGGLAESVVGAVSPRAREAIQGMRGRAYEKVRGADVSVAERIAKVPYLGAPFRTQERIPIRSLGSVDGREVKEVIEVPSASLLEPVEKAKNVAGPVLALMGIESIRRGSEKEAQMEPKYTEMLKVASHTIRAREAEIAQTKLAGLKLAGDVQKFAGQVEKLELEKDATDFALELLRREHITIDQVKTKVAELIGKGRDGLALERRALEYVEKDASRMGTADNSNLDEDAEPNSVSTDPVTEYLMQYAFEPSTPAGD